MSWIHKLNSKGAEYWECSECGAMSMIPKSDEDAPCPICVAERNEQNERISMELRTAEV